MHRLYGMLWLTLSLSAAQTSQGFERDHAAHVHGEGSLALVIENHDLAMQLSLPAMDVVGFEHAPSNAEQARAVHQAADTLNNASALFALPKSAGCTLESSDVHSTLLSDANTQPASTKHAHHDDHADHNHHKHHDHHDDEAHQDHHDHHAEHKDAHHHSSDSEKAEVHADFAAQYRYHCDHAEQIHELQVKLFNQLPRLEKLEVMIITSKGQLLRHASAESPVIKW
ncbi:MAG: DUF2796 domain-containing protein [Oleiphilaceae bacterium]|nr:DUF2796 domain-containing protein [Oleiphilaceae bacterium]